MTQSALVVGATGLVGSLLLERLLTDPDFAPVTVLTRRPIKIESEKAVQVVCGLDRMEEHKDRLEGDVIFCCLGTTIKKAGSEEAFRKVDHDYPMHLAKITKANGSKRFVLISALAANPQSRIFYNQVKGQTEQDIQRLRFDAFDCIRPSLILGERKESRLGEDVAKFLTPVLNCLLVGMLKKYRPIDADQIAKAMVAVSKQQSSGFSIHESDALQRY